jgi:predicted transcriptional regulator
MSVVVSVAKPPSARDVEIYSRLVREQALQAAVANEFGLSQSAVSRIYRRVAEYLAENGSGD